MFKRVFGTERNKPILMAFLQEITGAKILDLAFENSELVDAAEQDGKTVRLDVLATVQTVQGPQLVNIEVQNVAQAGLVGRAIYYWSRVYSGQLKEGMSYKDLHPTVVIFLLNEDLFAAEARHLSRYLLKEAETNQALDLGQPPMELLFIELSKVRKRLDSEPLALKNLNRWLVFLAADSDGVLEELRMQTQDRDLDQALTEIEYAALSKRDKLLYQARMDAIREERSNLQEAQAKGEAIGEAKGEAKGEANMLLRFAHRRFGSLPDPLQNAIRGFSSEQLAEAEALVAECTNAEAFEAAVITLKTRG
jgi:predicted transposase/invertase (TIGR01784 family)